MVTNENFMKKKKNSNYKTPRNEFHFYLKRVIKFNIQKNKKKQLPRKLKHKISLLKED